MKKIGRTYPRFAIWLKLALCIVSLCRAPSVAGAEPQAEASVICLDAEEPDTSGIEASSKLFFRELLRQAVLMSARDEVGQATRDRALREDFPDGAKVFAIKTSRSPSEGWQLTITSPSAGGNVLFQRRLDVPAGEPGIVDYLGPMAAAEELVRNDLKKFWRQQFADGKENDTKTAKNVPPETARDVEQMNCLSQLSALRDLHELHRAQGESPATMAALVRAYAHLGQLTMLHWNASHCVYQTRSLLYAQRWCAREPRSALAMWHRAYALALAGLHQQALLDLATAEELAKNVNDARQAARPAWVPLIVGLCRYDIDGLYEAVKKAGPHAQLAWLCTYLATEPGADADLQRLTIGNEALASVPDCLRISASMAITNGLVVKFKATTHGAKAAPPAWRTRLEAMNGLPPAVRFAADKIPTPAEDVTFGRGSDIVAQFMEIPPIVDACLAAGAADRGEPSLSALGRVLEDMTFLEVANRQNFFAVEWRVLPDDFAQAALDLFPTHPYRAYFDVRLLDPNSDGKNFWNRLADVDIVDADISHILLINRTWDSPHTTRVQGKRAFALAMHHADDVAYALTFCLQDAKDPGQQLYRAETLLKVSPYCPLGIATLIRLDWDKYAKGKEAELENQYGNRAIVLAALARQYLGLKRPDDAQRALEAYLKLSSDDWASRDLAEIYLARGDEAMWQSTLDAILNNEDLFLTHYLVQETVAEHFTAKKEWRKALPYAEAAADSGAGWAVDCLVKCHTALEQWDEAEECARYAGREAHGLRWYTWCRVTGHGNIKEARAAATDYYKGLEENAVAQNWVPIGYFKYGENDKEGALKAYRNAMELSKSPLAALFSALIMDEEHRDAERDELLSGIARLDPPEPHRKLIVRLAALIQSALARGPERRLDLAAVEAMVESTTLEVESEIYVVVGHYLENRGERKQAIEYFRRVAEAPGWRFPKSGATLHMTELQRQEGR